MKQKMLPVLFVILLLTQFSPAASVKPIFIFSLGGGFSMIADGAMRSNEYVFETLIDFKEKLKLKNLWSFNLQAYFLQNFGVQLEYTQQKADYFSDLKWYGWWTSVENLPVYVPIDVFENPYQSPWSLKSYCLSLIIGGDEALFGELFPYATAGIGFYKVRGDPELFLNRTRLGSLTHGMTVKISGGVRHRILPFLGINLRISGETLFRNHGRLGTERNYTGPDQFDLESYYETGNIIRVEQVLAKSFTYVRIEFNLEFILKMTSKTN